MGITTILVAVAIIVVVVAVAGSQISAFVNDTFASLGVQIRDDEVKIDAPKQGEIVCDLFITANWQERGTVVFAVNPLPILFFDPKDEEGVGIQATFVSETCHVSSGGFQFNSLLDFIGASSEVQPLDFIIPDVPIFDDPYELSWVLVQTDTGKERKLLHYQSIEYIVPVGVFDFRYEQKLVFRDVVPDDYTLKIIPVKNARFFDHDDGEVFLFPIPDPTSGF